jgi:hypothetical protein
MDPRSGHTLRALLLVNIALQVFDGCATYAGLGAGFGEGNPLLAWTLAHVGPLPALCLFKLEALGCLFVIWRLRHSRLALPALVGCAVLYLVCSAAPWTAALAHAHL